MAESCFVNTAKAPSAVSRALALAVATLRKRVRAEVELGVIRRARRRSHAAQSARRRIPRSSA